MKISSILAGALAAVVSATPIPGKEVSKRGAFGGAASFGNLFGQGFDVGLVNNFAFADPLLAHLAFINGVNVNVLQGLAFNNGLAFDGLAQALLFQGNAFGTFGLAELLNLHSFSVLSWISNNGLLANGVNLNGLAFPDALNFGLIGQFGLQDFVFQLAIEQAVQDQILQSLAGVNLFSGGFGGVGAAAVVQSTVIVKE